MKVDIQKFMELRNNAIARQQNSQTSAKKKINVEPVAKVFAEKTEKKRVAATDFDGSIEERVSALRERSAEGLPVRERGNFIDVRA
jgi:hypothetical protein